VRGLEDAVSLQCAHSPQSCREEGKVGRWCPDDGSAAVPGPEGLGGTWGEFPGLLLLSCLALVAYTWTTPFRELYGLESRNALMAREMLEGGMGYLPTVYGRPYFDYPPLYFWLETLFSRLPGRITTFTAVLPSALAASGLVFLAGCFGRLHGTRTAGIAAVLLATLPDFWIQASHATIDMLLAFHCGLAVYCFLRGEEGASRAQAVLWTAGGLGAVAASFLSKGIIGIVLPAGIWCGYLVWGRRWKSLAVFVPILGVWAGVLTGLHFALLWKTGGGELVREVIRQQVFHRVVGEANKPLWYYPAHLAILVSPWLFWLASFAWKAAGRDEAKNPFARAESSRSGPPLFPLAWIWVGVVFAIFSLAGSRHARYLLPLHLPLCLLLAYAVEWTDENGDFPRGEGWERFFSILAWLAVGAGAAALVLRVGDGQPPWVAGFLWIAFSLGGRWGVRFLVPREGNRCTALLALGLATGLMGFQALWEPGLSVKESGRSFVEAVEFRAALELPVLLYGISADGDGIKFALYSRRPPGSLRFVSSAGDPESSPKPAILVFFEKDRPGLTRVLSSCPWTELAAGFLHSRPVTALLMEEPCESSP